MAERPFVIAYHLVWTAYGTWLPNDPRGSGSHAVASHALAELGPLHYGRRKKQPARQIVGDFYRRAEPLLIHPVMRFAEEHIAIAGEALAEVVSAETYTCYGCAILPDHVHVIVRKHKHKAEEMIDRLQVSSRLRLSRFLAPNHPVWTLGGWKSFLSSPDAVRSAVRYVEHNPIKARLAPQRWPFVRSYDNWPNHADSKSNPTSACRLSIDNEAGSSQH